MNTIKIVPFGNASYDVFLDNTNISKYIRGVKISISAHEIPQVWLEIAAAQVEIPEELLALVVVEKEEKT